MTSGTTPYRALHAYAQRMTAAIDASDVEAYLRLLEERERLLAQVDRLAPPDDEDARAEARALLEAVLQIDADNATKLRGALEAAQQELGTMRGGRRAMHSYQAIVEREARFIDRGS